MIGLAANSAKWYGLSAAIARNSTTRTPKCRHRTGSTSTFLSRASLPSLRAPHPESAPQLPRPSPRNARVALFDLNEATVKAKAAALTGAKAWVCDVTDPERVETAVVAVEAEMGPIDILVNSAGMVELAPSEEISLSSWQRTIDVNLTGSFLMAQAVGRRMVTRQALWQSRITSPTAPPSLP